jgi:uncharacterized protein DUF1963
MDEIEARVREMIRASDIPAEVATALQDSLRYSIRLHTALASDEDLALGATKIGGLPDLPPDTLWPEWRGAPLNFLAQIHLADVATYDPEGELPHEGVLSFFFDYTNWAKPGREAEGSLATVLYVPEGALLQRQPWPEALPMRERYAPLAATSFSRELTAPESDGPFIERFGYSLQWLYLPDEWLPEGSYEPAMIARRIGDLMSDIGKFLHDTYDSSGWLHRLLGYGDGIQGGVEFGWQSLAKAIAEGESAQPAFGTVQEADWRLLLQVDSDENGMTWGDVGRIYYGLPREAFAARDFSQTIAELQCTGLPRLLPLPRRSIIFGERFFAVAPFPECPGRMGW